MSEFERSLAKELILEGGYVNHPKDPGGATNKGVTQRVYDAWRVAEGMAKRPVKLITDYEVKEIYRERYWNVIKGDQLPPGVSHVVFDGAVNSGPSQSVKWLQRALGVTVDGRIGQDTLHAVASHPNHDALIAKILERREAFLRALKTWKTFGKGWLSRLRQVKATGQAWAMGDVGPEVVFVPQGNAKAYVEDAKPAPSTAPGDTTAGAGSISVVIAQAQEQLAPYVAIDFVGKAVAALTIVGAVAALGGIAYRMWAKHRAAQRADALDLAVPA